MDRNYSAERLEVMRELDSLSVGQRKILIAIAEGYNKGAD